MAALSCLHVAVEAPQIWRADADVPFAKLGGGTSPSLSHVGDVPLARMSRYPRTSYFVPGEF